MNTGRDGNGHGKCGKQQGEYYQHMKERTVDDIIEGALRDCGEHSGLGTRGPKVPEVLPCFCTHCMGGLG